MNGKKSKVIFGLTGIMGSGKSTVAGMLAERGAIVISEDKIAKSLQQPGKLVMRAMVAAMGPQILDETGNLDRPATAHLLFSDDSLRLKVEEIVHPQVLRIIQQEIQEISSHVVVVLDAAILLAANKIKVTYLVNVDSTEDQAIDRLTRLRNFTINDCLARMSKQPNRQELLRQYDYIIDNSHTLQNLADQLEPAWQWMSSKHDKIANGS